MLFFVREKMDSGTNVKVEVMRALPDSLIFVVVSWIYSILS